MKTVFVHDTTFIKYNNNYYAKDGLDEEVFNMYKKYFGNVFVVSRYEEVFDKNNPYVRKENIISSASFCCGKSFIDSIRLLKNNIKTSDFVILRVHSFNSVIAFYYILKYKKLYMVESVSCAWDCLWYHSLKGKILAPFMYIITKIIVSSASYVTYVSEFLKRRYDTKHDFLICSDVRLNNNVKIKSSFNKKLKLCTIANVDVKYKGHAYVIKALSFLKKNNIFFDYYLVGGGSGIKLKKLIKKYGLDDYVHFVGPIPHQNIFEYLKNIDIYIQPSDAESHGRVILEAQSVGVPVISSSTGGMPEIVNEKFVFKKKNYKSLSEKLIDMISNDNLIYQKKWSLENANKFMPYVLNKKRSEFYEKIEKRIL